MLTKLSILIAADDVIPRFDLAVEAHIITCGTGCEMETNTGVLPQTSAEKLCHPILTESITFVICGAIEEACFQLLSWKKITVIDTVTGPWDKALLHHLNGELTSGAILCHRTVEGYHVDLS